MGLFRKLTPKEEKTFRAWARANYKPFTNIREIFHPVVQDECRKMNEEANDISVKDERHRVLIAMVKKEVVK